MNTDFATVESLERRLLEPESRISGVLLDELLDDNFLEIGRSGRMFDKAAIVKSMQGSNQLEVEIDSVRCRYLTDDTVLINYRSWRPSGDDSAYALRTSIWQRKRNSWKMIFHQGTPTNPPT